MPEKNAARCSNIFVKINDTRLFFDVEGAKLIPDGEIMREKPVLICLHGGPGLDHTGFRPTFSALAKIAQIIYLDMRGHGRSERSVPEKWGLAQWADDLQEFCNVLGIEKPIVLGTSFGGYVGMKYAIRYPEQPVKLILISTSARGTAVKARQENVLRAFERRGGIPAREAVRRAFEERTLEAYEIYTRICGPLYNRKPPNEDSRKRTIKNSDIIPFFEQPGGEGAIFDLTSELSAITCPTLVIAGEDDPITPVEEQEEIINSMQNDRARLLRFPNCGHGILRDKPGLLVRAIGDFINDEFDTTLQ